MKIMCGQMMSPSNSRKRLLLLSCSAKKKDLTETPALEVYDGPSYRLLRKYHRECLDILIMSAKFGLISANQRISPYEKKMTDKLADEFRSEYTAKLKEILRSDTYDEIYVDLGKTYRNAIEFSDPAFRTFNIQFNNGTIGLRLHNLKLWLMMK